VNEVLGEILPIALAIAASPFPVIPAILLLFTARPRATGLSFLAGWSTGVLLATAAFVLLAGVVEVSEETPAWASWARLALGAVLVVLGVSRWRYRSEKTETPAWMAALDDATPRSALRLGFLLSAANPKILLLAAAAGIAIGSAELPAGDTALAVAVVTVIGSLSVAVPVLLYVARGEGVLAPLGRARTWLERNNAAVMAVVITVIGVLLLLKGYQGLR
jgi:threonine/homoserine/homoserine lactone efflux protein